MADNLLRLTGLYRRESQRTGRVYYTGRLGDCRLLAFVADEPADGEPALVLYLAPREDAGGRGGGGERQADGQRPLPDTQAADHSRRPARSRAGGGGDWEDGGAHDDGKDPYGERDGNARRR